MEVLIQKWGNSMGLRIPAKMVKKFHLHEGSAVELKLQEGSFEVIPKKHNLDDMLLKITEKNLHIESFTQDDIKGDEEW